MQETQTMQEGRKKHTASVAANKAGQQVVRGQCHRLVCPMCFTTPMPYYHGCHHNTDLIMMIRITANLARKQ